LRNSAQFCAILRNSAQFCANHLTTRNMLALQIGPYTATTLAVSLATCPRWLPPPLAPPPSSPPELRPTELIEVGATLPQRFANLRVEDVAESIAAGVFGVYEEKLEGLSPPGFNCSVDVHVGRRLNSSVLLSNPSAPPPPPWGWLAPAVEDALPGCAEGRAAKGADRVELCRVDVVSTRVLDRRRLRRRQSDGRRLFVNVSGHAAARHVESTAAAAAAADADAAAAAVRTARAGLHALRRSLSERGVVGGGVRARDGYAQR